MTQTIDPVVEHVEITPATSPATPPGRHLFWRILPLVIGALVFLFPFYYMIIGSLQKKTDTSLSGALPQPAT